MACPSLKQTRHRWSEVGRDRVIPGELDRHCVNCPLIQTGTAIPKVVRDQFLLMETVMRRRG